MYNIIPERKYTGINSATIASSKAVIAKTKEQQNIKAFPSLAEAGRWIQVNQNKTESDLCGITGNIRKCCQKKRKSAYGYYWEYL